MLWCVRMLSVTFGRIHLGHFPFQKSTPPKSGNHLRGPPDETQLNSKCTAFRATLIFFYGSNMFQPCANALQKPPVKNPTKSLNQNLQQKIKAKVRTMSTKQNLEQKTWTRNPTQEHNPKTRTLIAASGEPSIWFPIERYHYKLSVKAVYKVFTVPANIITYLPNITNDVKQIHFLRSLCNLHAKISSSNTHETEIRIHSKCISHDALWGNYHILNSLIIKICIQLPWRSFASMPRTWNLTTSPGWSLYWYGITLQTLFFSFWVISQ